MESVDTYTSADWDVAPSTGQETQPRKILAAVGGRGADDAGLQYAAKLAGETGAAVRVLHLREREIYSGHRFAVESVDDAKRLVEKAVSALQEAGITASGSVQDTLVGREGVAIVDEAANWGAEAIVLGPGPVRSWRRLFARGVRGQVLRLSAIPVMVATLSPGQGSAVLDAKTDRGRERHAA